MHMQSNRPLFLILPWLTLAGVALSTGAAFGKAAAPGGGGAAHAAPAPGGRSPSEPPVYPAKTPAPKPAAPQPKTWALLVGVSKYQSDQIASLKYPSTDASGLRDALEDPALGGLPNSQVLLLTDDQATHDNITGAVDNFFKPNVKPGDKVIVFLAGHGVAKGVGLEAKSFLLPTDVKGLTIAALESSAVDLRALSDALGALPASQFVIFVDACREDPTPGRGLKGNQLTDVMTQGMEVVPENPASQSATFFACSVGERAYEDATYGHGVFTNWIIQGIREGAVPQKPDGAVDMGRLSSYVEQKVEQWAKDSSANGDFEVEQTPELVASQLNSPLVLMNVKRPLTDDAITPNAPHLLIATSPPGAVVSINGQRTGSGEVDQSLPSGGQYSLNVSAPGYAPVARSVTALPGYEHQVDVNLQPTTAAAPDGGSQADSLYKKGVAAAAHEQWEVAEQAYEAAEATDATYIPAYEALYELHREQNRNIDTIGDALGLVANAPAGEHPYSLLSRAYSRFAEKGPGDDNANTTLTPANGYGLPANPAEAAGLAQRAATAALAAEPGSDEANLADGYALAALDTAGHNKRAALGAFGKSVLFNDQDAANQLGMGYGIRYYAVQIKDADAQQSEIQRAILSLKQAITLRPNYYDAHRELAYCYTLLSDTPDATHEYEEANANRGAATDANEIAANDVALCGLHKKQADASTGDQKANEQAASDGYMADAHETSPDLKVAVQILGAAGLSTSLTSYLPPDVQGLLNIQATVTNTVTNTVKNKIPKLGGFHLPF